MENELFSQKKSMKKIIMLRIIFWNNESIIIREMGTAWASFFLQIISINRRILNLMIIILFV